MTSIYFARDASQKMKADTSVEKELLQAALRFDHKALGQIYDLYSPELYRYAARFLGDPCRGRRLCCRNLQPFLESHPRQARAEEVTSRLISTASPITGSQIIIAGHRMWLN